MIKKTKLISVLLVNSLLMFTSIKLKAQTAEVKTTWGEGTIVVGYVDEGAYINFTGPALKYSSKPFSLLVGLLPSLRVEEDKSESGTRNSLITPSLCFGLTGSYKHFVIQIPLFYNPKTANENGKWNVGVGLGYKL